MSTKFLYFDDTSPVFTYSNNWFDNTRLTGFLANGVFNNTLSSTTTIGSTVSIEFVASQIVVIGATIAPQNAPSNSGPITSYVLDNSKNSAFLFQANAQNATGVNFFNSGILTAGKHTLEITILQVTDGIPFLLDAVAVGQPETSTPSTAVWVTTVFSTGTSAPTSILSGNSTTAGNVSESKSLPVGAIVGGVVGGVALIVGAALAFFFLFYRRKRKDYDYHGFARDPVYSDKDNVPASPPVPLANEGRFSTQYQQYEPFLSPASPSAYTDSTLPAGAASPHPSMYSAAALGPHASMYSPAVINPHMSMYSTAGLGQHASIYSAAALGIAGTGTGAVAAAALAAPHTYPPAAGSVTSSSASGAGRGLSVMNDTGDVSAAGQLKAAEAAGEKGEGLQPDQPVQFHADSGVRFDEQGNPIVPSGSGSGSGSGAHEPEPIDVPPEYTEI